MRAASPAASRLAGVSRPAARRVSSASAMAGSRATASSMSSGGVMSSAKARPRGVGAAGQAGRTKAHSSNKSNAGRGRRPRRRSVTGACTSSGIASPSSAVISAGVPVASSPSPVRMLARPWPATIAADWGVAGACIGIWWYMSPGGCVASEETGDGPVDGDGVGRGGAGAVEPPGESARAQLGSGGIHFSRPS